MSVNERINFLISQFEGGNKSAFAEKIGSKSGVIGDLVGGRLNKPSFGVIEKLVTAYPLVNAEWLITGEGEPFKESGTNAPKDNVASSISNRNTSSGNTVTYGDSTSNQPSAEVEMLRRALEMSSASLHHAQSRIAALEKQNTELLDKLIQSLSK